MTSQTAGPATTRRFLAGTAFLGTLMLALAGCAGSVDTGQSEPAPSATASLRSPAPEGDLPAELQSALQEVVDQTMSEYAVPGSAVGVWIPGEGAWLAATGLADQEQGTPVSLDMWWPLRSVTKSYTVTLVLQLVDEGLVSLDDTIDQYVDGVTDGDQITLRELADMSSGNADYINEDFVAAFEQDPEQLFTLQELNGFMLGKPAQFSPGTRKVYTNANTNLLGAVVEAATGEAFADVLEERILRPLGQEHTEYLTDASAWPEPHAVGYMPGEGALAPQDQNFSILGAAGALVSTLDDARAWAEALATGALLQPATQAEREQGAPLEVGRPYGLYALGIGETDGWWGHNGEGVGFTAAVFHQPETGASIVVFMNESNVEPRAHPADQTFRRLAAVLADQAG